RPREGPRCADARGQPDGRRPDGDLVRQAHPAQVRGRRSGLRRDRDGLWAGLPLRRARLTVAGGAMDAQRRHPRRWRLPLGLRFALALAMLPLLALPLVGLRFAEVMTELARNERLENQAQAARNLAASLH